MTVETSSSPILLPEERSKDELQQKVTLLHEYLDNSIADVTKKRSVNQRRATIIKVLILCLSGTSTILLGLDLGKAGELLLKNLAFAFISIVTVLNALEPYFNYRALWVEHEKATAAFFAIKDRLSFYAAGKCSLDFDKEKIDQLYTEYESSWAALNQAWSSQRQKSFEAAGVSKP